MILTVLNLVIPVKSEGRGRALWLLATGAKNPSYATNDNNILSTVRCVHREEKLLCRCFGTIFFRNPHFRITPYMSRVESSLCGVNTEAHVLLASLFMCVQFS